MVVAVFAVEERNGVAGVSWNVSRVPIAPALVKSQTGEPGRFVVVTSTGAATPVRAAVE